MGDAVSQFPLVLPSALLGRPTRCRSKQRRRNRLERVLGSTSSRPVHRFARDASRVVAKLGRILDLALPVDLPGLGITIAVTRWGNKFLLVRCS